MKTLWFKQVYVGPILAGTKADKIRKPGSRPYRVGEAIALCVGPRAPFAQAVVTDFGEVPAASLGDRLAAVRGFYGDRPTYTRLAFKLTNVFDQCPEVVKARAAARSHT